MNVLADMGTTQQRCIVTELLGNKETITLSTVQIPKKKPVTRLVVVGGLRARMDTGIVRMTVCVIVTLMTGGNNRSCFNLMGRI